MSSPVREAFMKVANHFLNTTEVNVSQAVRAVVAIGVVAVTAGVSNPAQAFDLGGNFKNVITQSVKSAIGGDVKVNERTAYGGRRASTNNVRGGDSASISLDRNGLNNSSPGAYRTSTPKNTYEYPARFRKEVDGFLKNPNLGAIAAENTRGSEWTPAKRTKDGFTMFRSDRGDRVWLDRNGRASDYGIQPAVVSADGSYQHFNNGRLAPQPGRTLVSVDKEGQETHVINGELVAMAPVEDRSIRSTLSSDGQIVPLTQKARIGMKF